MLYHTWYIIHGNCMVPVPVPTIWWYRYRYLLCIAHTCMVSTHSLFTGGSIANLLHECRSM